MDIKTNKMSYRVDAEPNKSECHTIKNINKYRVTTNLIFNII